MFISPAFAEATTETVAEGGSMLLSMVPILLILAVFYFMVIRPQNKRLQEHRRMVGGLQKGDKVVTGGGLIATVRRTVGSDEVILDIAEGVQIHALRSTIMMMRSKSLPSEKKVTSEKKG
ncbi:MAG: preprotein translocase subunit YajC [Alphaproteobacteria bacterium]|nr:preprotein translocase subunit YajC [Alphaproteobacteria bacterium]